MSRRSNVEDWIGIASTLPWRTNLAVAVVSGLVLHGIAVLFALEKAPMTSSALGLFAARSMLSTFATLLQVIVPVIFIFSAIASYCKRSQTYRLIGQAHSGGQDAIRGMTWAQFERLIGEVFRQRGYEITEQGGSAPDGGIDLVLKRDGNRFLVQCKHWRARKVGVTVIRELRGVMAVKGAAGGLVVTTGEFTGEAWKFADSCQIQLIDGNGLASLIQARRPEGEQAAIPSRLNSIVPSCPQCGATMTKRMAKRGVPTGTLFWGCRDYPRCRGTRPTGT